MLSPRQASLPQSRVNALWSLEGLNALTDQDILIGLNDPVSQVRAQGVELAAGRLRRSPRLLEKVLSLADDPDGPVRFQTVLAIGVERGRPGFAGALPHRAPRCGEPVDAVGRTQLGFLDLSADAGRTLG